LYDDDDDHQEDTLNVSLDGATTFRDEWNEALDFVHAQRVSEFWHDDDDAQQERWARLQMDDDDDHAQQQQQQLGFALYNDQGMATLRCALVSKLWRARVCVCALCGACTNSHLHNYYCFISADSDSIDSKDWNDDNDDDKSWREMIQATNALLLLET
jgi:hypothetical protein